MFHGLIAQQQLLKHCKFQSKEKLIFSFCSSYMSTQFTMLALKLNSERSMTEINCKKFVFISKVYKQTFCNVERSYPSTEALCIFMYYLKWPLDVTHIKNTEFQQHSNRVPYCDSVPSSCIKLYLQFFVVTRFIRRRMHGLP